MVIQKNKIQTFSLNVEYFFLHKLKVIFKNDAYITRDHQNIT